MLALGRIHASSLRLFSMPAGLTPDARQAWLRPLLEPRSIAVIGASARPGRPGHDVLKAARLFNPAQAVFPVTPRYEEIDGLRCYEAIARLGQAVDLAVVAGSSERIEAHAREALEAGARSLVVFARAESAQIERIGRLAREWNVPVLGPNAIGYVNYVRGTVASWILPARAHREPGSIAFICQSGALYSYVNALDPRLRFSLTVHPGQEAVLGLADYMHYALSLPETKLIGLYLESLKDPSAFVAALARAREAGVPVVVMKPGRTQAARHSVETHAGRLAGSDAGFDAVFERYGVHRVDSLDELWTTLRVFSAGWQLKPGGLSVITDSGGQRSVLIDAASRLDIPLTTLTQATQAVLRQTLAPELETTNPIDIWAGEEDLVGHATACLDAVASDPGTAIAAVMTEFGSAETDGFPEGMGAAGLAVARASGTPVAAISFSTRHFATATILDLERGGLPCLDGLEVSLKAIRHLLDHRDVAADATPSSLPRVDIDAVRAAVGERRGADEAAALRVLAAAGVPVVRHAIVDSAAAAVSMAETIGYPVVLKTAEGVAHKTEARGVYLDLRSAREVEAAWQDLDRRLGPRALVARMAAKGIELAIGIVSDPMFGPLVVIAAGGTLVEVLDDKAVGLAPVSPDGARRLLRRLKVCRLLDGVRGASPADFDALADAISRLSCIGAALSGEIESIDVNPLIARADGCVAVDALIQYRNEDTP